MCSRLSLSIIFLVISISWLPASKCPATPPNIVLILADDFGRELLTNYGGQSGYETPNLDRMSREGMQFNTCFSTPFTFTWGNFENNSSKYKDPSHNTDKLLDAIRGPRYKLYSDGRLFDVQRDFLEQHPIEIGESMQADQAREQLKANLQLLRQTQPGLW